VSRFVRSIPRDNRREEHFRPAAMGVVQRGQVAQVVERSPEKAGVGGSTPSLATIISKHLRDFPKISPPKIHPR
jgi:hypothetical protein